MRAPSLPTTASARRPACAHELDKAQLARVVGGTANTGSAADAGGNKIWQDDWLAPI